jgi:putative colanic acid biosynthesis UDP-glucose lipid carrier transferase
MVTVSTSLDDAAGVWHPVGGRAKRLFDFCFAALVLAILGPFLLLIALAIRIDSPGPAIFRQDRGGFRGRTFSIWKFRTMTVMEEAEHVRQALPNDIRLTRIGGFLRQTSLDEFPQLINVLIGEMSIVGPRPHALLHDLEFAAMDRRYHHRALARPGMTGLAQVSGSRGPICSPEAAHTRVTYDVDYVERWSFALDLRIIARTLALICVNRTRC